MIRPSDRDLADCTAVHADGAQHSEDEMRQWEIGRAHV